MLGGFTIKGPLPKTMNSIFKFTLRYFIFTVILLVTEICIAMFVHDTIIRPYIGDLLVVILIYCIVRAFFNTPVLPTAIAVLVFSFAVEITQYFHLIRWLGLQHSRLASVVLGNSFAWMDLVLYTAGIIIVLVVEKITTKRENNFP